MNEENLLSLTILFYVYWRSICLSLGERKKRRKGSLFKRAFHRRYEMYFSLIKYTGLKHI